jgi:hypothetical protein
MKIETCKLIIGKGIKYIFLVFILIALGFFSMSFYSSYKKNNTEKQEVAAISNENTPTGKVLGEEGPASSADASRMYSSQNFQTPQITFGGDAITVPSGQQANAPEILNLRSELLLTKTDQQVKFLLTWKTNKLCESSIEYMKEGQTEGKIVSDDSFGFVHSVEIAPINYATTYSYIVTARDKWGTETKSDKLAFYSGAKNVSIFDLLGSAFKDMFGWTTK